jgi:hypothetical protein
VPKLAPFSDEQLRVIREMWIEGVSIADICAAVGVKYCTFKERRATTTLKDLPPRSNAVQSSRRGIDPSVEEIAERAAAIRAGWDSDELARR